MLSCDCFGTFNNSSLKKFIHQKNPDVILFAFKISELHKKLRNSHTSIMLNNNKNIKAISVKKFNNHPGEQGHAGFFWIRNNSIFDNLGLFKKSNKSNRELILDDYFKFLFDKNLNKISCFKLNEYVHIGSIKEYHELNYWVNFLKMKISKIIKSKALPSFCTANTDVIYTILSYCKYYRLPCLIECTSNQVNQHGGYIKKTKKIY